MANGKQTISAQRKDEQSIDIKQIVYLFLSHWYLFAAFVVLALGICFLVNRYSTKIYQTTGTVLIKDGKNEYDPTTIMTTMNFGDMQNIDNEIAILTSYALRERVVKKMGIEVTYLEKGRIAKKELYKSAPFLVEFDRSVPQAVGLNYEIAFLNNGKVSLHGTGEGLNKYDFILCQSTESNPFAIIDSVSVYLNSKGEGYADLNTNLNKYATTISEIVTDNFAKYTKDEAQNNRDLIKDEILKQI